MTAPADIGVLGNIAWYLVPPTAALASFAAYKGRVYCQQLSATLVTIANQLGKLVQHYLNDQQAQQAHQQQLADLITQQVMQIFAQERAAQQVGVNPVAPAEAAQEHAADPAAADLAAQQPAAADPAAADLAAQQPAAADPAAQQAGLRPALANPTVQFPEEPNGPVFDQLSAMKATLTAITKTLENGFKAITQRLSASDRARRPTFFQMIRYQYNPLNTFDGLYDSKNVLFDASSRIAGLYLKWVTVPQAIYLGATELTKTGTHPTVVGLKDLFCSLPYAGALWCKPPGEFLQWGLSNVTPVVGKAIFRFFGAIVTETANQGRQAAQETLQDIGDGLGTMARKGMNTTTTLVQEFFTTPSQAIEKDTPTYRAAHGIRVTSTPNYFRAPVEPSQQDPFSTAEPYLPALAGLVMSCALVYLIGSGVASLFRAEPKIEQKDKK